MNQWVANVLGHGVVISTDDGRVDALARAAFGPTTAVPIGHVRFVRRNVSGLPRLHAGIHRYLSWSGGASGVIDCTRWRGTVGVGSALLRDGARLRYLVIEAACLFLATAYDRVPVHAAAIERDGRALLVAGAPGSGKSTLALTAARAGWTVLAEDVVFVQRRPRLQLWGIGRYIHLRPEVAARLHAAEIAGRVLRTGNVDKRAIPIGTCGARAAVPGGVVLLTSGRTLALDAVSPDLAAQALVAALPGGFRRFEPETAVIAPLLTAPGAWRLTVADRPERAWPVLESLLSPS